MDARARWRDDAHMPLDLTDLELETAARACRALAYQEEQATKWMENPTMRGPIENTAKRAAALAEKFERARKQRSV
jgi:predicted phage tail protein